MGTYPHLSEVTPQDWPHRRRSHRCSAWSSLGVVRQCRKRKLPGLKIGSRWYIHVAKLAAQLDREAADTEIAEPVGSSRGR